MFEHTRDALEQRQIDVLPPENVVNVLPVAVQPTGKFAHAQARCLKIFLYFFSCVYFHSFLRYVHQTPHKKKVELSFDSLHSVGSGLPVSKILKNKPHLFVFGNKYSQASLISDIRTNIRELSRFTETDKRKLAFFSIKNRCHASRHNNGAKIQKRLADSLYFLTLTVDFDFCCWLLALTLTLTMTLTVDRKP